MYSTICVQNQDLVTNFQKDQREIYEEVVKLWGDDIFITEDAYWINGHRDPEMCALRRREGVLIDSHKLFALVHDIKVKHGYVVDVL